MPNLYDLTTEAQQLAKVMLNEDLDDEQRAAVLARHRECTQEDLPQKLEARAIMVKNLKADADQQKIQADYHARRAATAKKRADWLANDTKEWLEHAGLSKYKAGIFTLSVAKCGGKQAIDIAPDADPVLCALDNREFVVEVPARWEFDKDKLRLALEHGDAIPGLDDGTDPETGKSINPRPMAKLRPRGTRLAIR